MIIATINVKGQTYELNERHVKQMELAGITSQNVRVRLRSGWLLDDAVQAPKGVHLYDWLNHKALENETKLKLERQKQRAKEELRRKKPHLFHVPQKHGKSKYAKSLENNLIVKLKTDCYGQIQRG